MSDEALRRVDELLREGGMLWDEWSHMRSSEKVTHRPRVEALLKTLAQSLEDSLEHLQAAEIAAEGAPFREEASTSGRKQELLRTLQEKEQKLQDYVQRLHDLDFHLQVVQVTDPELQED